MSSPSDRSERTLPKLAYVYHPRSFATLSLAAAAAGVCDLVWVVDTSLSEVASMARLLRKFGPTVDVAGVTMDEAAALVAPYDVDGILALADDMLSWTADLAETLGLVFHTPATVKNLTDKHAQRDALALGGLVVPKSWVIPAIGPEPVWATIELEASYPSVLKPRKGEASRDTLPVSSFGELRSLYSSLTEADERPREFVLEEYIADSSNPVAGEGFAGYVSVESFMQDGEITHLAVNGRMPPAHPFRETGFFIPSTLDAPHVDAVLSVAGDAAKAVGVKLGCLHTEIKLTPSGPVVIEVNGRIGGGVPEMLMGVTGVNLISLAMRLASGVAVTQAAMPDCQGVAYLFYVQAPAGMHTVTAVVGLDELRGVKGVDEITLNRGPGQLVDWREGNHGHVFSVLGRVDSHAEVLRIHELIGTMVRIEGE